MHMANPYQSSSSIRSLFGMSLLSGAGSVPYQMSPLIIAVLVDQSRASIAQAGAMASAILIGQLVAALALPKVGGLMNHRWFTTAAAALLLAGLLLTAINAIFFAFLGWFLVGLSCGALVYLGTIVSAQHNLPRFAFTLRLGVAGILTGLCALTIRSGTAHYTIFLVLLALFFVATLSAGMLFFRNDGAVGRHGSGNSETAKWRVSDSISLLTAYLFFIGQAGFAAYVVQQAAPRGIALGDAVWTLAGVKLISGVGLILLARRELMPSGRNYFFGLGGLLAASIVATSLTESLAMFFIGLLAFQIALNALSSQLQARVSEVSPNFVIRWLPAAILLGAATGPLLNGVAISLGAPMAFLLFAIASSFLPATWDFLAASRRRVS